MKLAHLVPHGVHPYSGLLHAVVGLSLALAVLRHRVELWQFAGPDPLSESSRDGLRRAGVERVEIPAASGWRLGRDGQRAIAARDVELVHFHGVFSPLNDLVARTLRAPYVFSPHGGYSAAVLSRHRVRKLLWSHLLELRKLRGAAVAFALSHAEREDVRRFGFGGPIEVVPNGVEELPAARSGGGFRHEVGLDAAARLAIFVGRLDVHHKGLDCLVRALARAPGWHLALVGPDWQGDSRTLGALVRRLALSERIFVLPPRRGAALREALEAASLFVLPSRWEGQSLALLQALRCGLPALVSPEVERTLGVARAGAGWVAERSGLSDALNALSQMDVLEWARRSEAARELASTFSWNRSALGYAGALARAGLGAP